eukprot:CFRG5032T1
MTSGVKREEPYCLSRTRKLLEEESENAVEARGTPTAIVRNTLNRVENAHSRIAHNVNSMDNCDSKWTAVGSINLNVEDFISSSDEDNDEWDEEWESNPSYAYADDYVDTGVKQSNNPIVQDDYVVLDDAWHLNDSNWISSLSTLFRIAGR